MTDLSGRVALVTGGAAGIGAAIVQAFLRSGATVLSADLVAAEQDGVESVLCDVTDAAAVERAVEVALTTLGGLDVVVCNAGVLGPVTPMDQLSVEDFEQVMAVNVDGPWHVMRAAIPPMLAAGGGAIVNVASVNGLRTAANAAAYSASKHALVGLTKTAAIEYAAYGVRVNALCPGGVATTMLDTSIGASKSVALSDVPMARLAAPTEVADAAVWLASDDAAYVTGHALLVDGGLLAG